jgi:hypothetical protein
MIHIKKNVNRFHVSHGQREEVYEQIKNPQKTLVFYNEQHPEKRYTIYQNDHIKR